MMKPTWPSDSLFMSMFQMKAKRKVEVKQKKKMADKLRAEVYEYQMSLNDFERNILTSQSRRP